MMASFLNIPCVASAGKKLCRQLFNLHLVPSLQQTFMHGKRFSTNFTTALRDLQYRYFLCGNVVHARCMRLSSVNACNENGEQPDDSQKKIIDPSKDRTAVIPPEVSIRYMESKAYRTTYGDDPVWVKYRRNFKGGLPPLKTRRACIRGGVISTGNPCPICRDEYLVLHHSNVKLLSQFICPYTGEIYETKKTNLCRKRQFELEVVVERAKDLGLLTYEVPFRTYDYADYYPQLKAQNDA